MPDIFLSYSRDDQSIARRFAEGLERAGLSVWWDQALNPGEAFDQVTEKALEEAKAVIVLWSKVSVKSRWVRAEATQANADNRLVPVMIEACKRPIMFELTHTAELANWKGNSDDPSWQSFVNSLQRFIGKQAVPVSVAKASVKAAPMHRKPVVIALAALGLLVIGIIIWPGVRGVSGEPPHAEPPLPGPVTGKVVLAVLPFEYLSSDDDKGYIAFGLTEAVSSHLQLNPALQITGEESSRMFKGSAENARAIAAALGVKHLLYGQVQPVAGKVQISVQLVDGASGTRRWTTSYAPREFDDAYALGQEIAKDVARDVGVALEVGELPPSLGGTDNPRANEKFLRAKELVARSAGSCTIDPGVAIDVGQLLRDALEMDPNFHMARFMSYVSITPAASADPRNALGMLRLKEDLAKLLDAAPRSWQLASGYRAERLRTLHRWAEALDAAGHMSIPTPGSMNSRGQMGFYLLATGQFEDAIAVLREATLQDPLAAIPSGLLVDALQLLGRDADAQVEINRLRQALGVAKECMSPPTSLESLLSGSSTDPVALQALKARLRGPDGRIAGELWFLDGKPVGMLDDAAALRRALAAALGEAQNQGRLRNLAAFAQFFGDTDTALAALGRIDEVSQGAVWPTVIWRYPSLRSDERFKEILRQTGIVDYWRGTGKWGDFCNEDKSAKDGFTCH